MVFLDDLMMEYKNLDQSSTYGNVDFDFKSFFRSDNTAPVAVLVIERRLPPSPEDALKNGRDLPLGSVAYITSEEPDSTFNRLFFFSQASSLTNRQDAWRSHRQTQSSACPISARRIHRETACQAREDYFELRCQRRIVQIPAHSKLHFCWYVWT